MSTGFTGKIDFRVGAETYQTWYKVFGDTKNAMHCPVVAVHGGPGMSHHYMLWVFYPVMSQRIGVGLTTLNRPHKAVYEQEG